MEPEAGMTILGFFAYLKYVLRHKWFVYVAMIKIKSAPTELAILAFTHDMSKFLPVEFGPYAKTFYDKNGAKQYQPDMDFDTAWNHHQKANKHHWQYWILNMDSGETRILPMDDIYIYEMVADWMGAGRAITGRWEVGEWYKKNHDKMKLHPYSREIAEAIIAEVAP
jgi:hypothetical protein